MAILRDRPYTSFNFLVNLGTGDDDRPEGGFEEVSGLDSFVDVIEYRNGNSKENSVIKLNGLNHVSDVTLRRGQIGSLNLYQWFDEIRNGGAGAYRTVTISLQNEDHSEIVMRWKLARARIVKHTSGPLDGASSDVAIEEIVLAYERLELE